MGEDADRLRPADVARVGVAEVGEADGDLVDRGLEVFGGGGVGADVDAAETVVGVAAYPDPLVGLGVCRRSLGALGVGGDDGGLGVRAEAAKGEPVCPGGDLG